MRVGMIESHKQTNKQKMIKFIETHQAKQIKLT